MRRKIIGIFVYRQIECVQCDRSSEKLYLLLKNCEDQLDNAIVIKMTCSFRTLRNITAYKN